MKTYWRIMGFAKPIEKYALPYFFYTLFYAVFNIVTFALVGPIVKILFGEGPMLRSVTVMPEIELSNDFVANMLNYLSYKVIGPGYGMMDILVCLAIILITVAFLSNFFRYLAQRTMENMKIRTLQKIRDAVFDNVMGLQIGFFSNERKGDIISKITSDVQVVQFCVSSTLQAVFRDPFLIIAYMTYMVIASWQLTIFSAIFLPIVAVVIGVIVKKLRRKATAGQQAYADMVSAIDESLTGAKIIKAYNATDATRDKFHKINRLYSRIMRSMSRRQQLASPMSEFLGISAMAVMLVFGGNLVMNGVLDGSTFLVYIGVFSQIVRPVRSFADAFANINQGIAAGERVLALLDTPSTINDKPDAKVLERFENSIEFNDVRFSYEQREVICGINFCVNKGETVALVGPSGGGKSTISDLIPRFYDVTGGAITISGIDIRDLTRDSLRAHIGVVSQDTILFNDTIEGNIRMGKPGATDEEIVAAAKVANAHEFIMESENGYQTNIGDRGIKLSGGQRQRLSIARAVLKNPDILILDEATSALDAESEKLVQGALDTLLKGRTSIVIAHRLSTINNADKIIVIEQGRIAEQGTHKDLVKKEGLYCKLVNLQQMT